MTKLLLAGIGLALSLNGAAHADCTLPAGNVPYDYFNRSTSPRTEWSGVSCQTVMNARAQDEAQFGDPGTSSRTSDQNWSWYGCNSGQGLDLAYAAKQLTIWGCSSGWLCNGNNGNCIPY